MLRTLTINTKWCPLPIITPLTAANLFVFELQLFRLLVDALWQVIMLALPTGSGVELCRCPLPGTLVASSVGFDLRQAQHRP